MDQKTNGEQPAFRDSTTNAHQHGLTKREEFARSAFVALLAAEQQEQGVGFRCDLSDVEKVAENACIAADALLRALAAGGEG